MSVVRPDDRGADLVIRHLRTEEIGLAARLLARAMRDTPTSIAVHAGDAVSRERQLAPIFDASLRTMTETSLCALAEDRLVGVAGLAPPGMCDQVTRWQSTRALALAHVSPATAWRFRQWRHAWAAEDPAVPHWHLGPVGVDPTNQARGIGGRLMDEVCRFADDRHGSVYLETDSPRNVRFYLRWRFAVATEREVLGQPNWFMQRRTGSPA